jgi:hypothetical protein
LNGGGYNLFHRSNLVGENSQGKLNYAIDKWIVAEIAKGFFRHEGAKGLEGKILRVPLCLCAFVAKKKQNINPVSLFPEPDDLSFPLAFPY